MCINRRIGTITFNGQKTQKMDYIPPNVHHLMPHGIIL